MSERFYLDYNATAPLRPEVQAAMVTALARYGNPSSVHAEGREARAVIEAAREKVAALVGADSEDVIFTSGGTEANALALAPAAHTNWRCYVSAIEHPSVLSGGRFGPEAIRRIPVTEEGVVDLEWLAAELATDEARDWRPLVSLMLANNETGAVQPVAEAAEIFHGAGGLLHSDAVQAAGRLRIDLQALGADMLTLSAHKIGGPKGVGALIVKSGVAIEPLYRGGGQERRKRAGTENVAGIAGFGVAAELAAQELGKTGTLLQLRDELERGALADAPEAVVLSSRVARLPNTSCIAVPGAKAETLVIGLDLAGVAVSAGSACSSGKVEASHVLTAMGVPPEIAQGAVRVSLGFGTRSTDIQSFLGAWSELVARLKQSCKAAA